MNIYQVLSQDHRVFEALLDRLVAASKADSDDWKAALDELRRSLIPHSHAEEAIFYNALREADQAKKLIVESYNEHAMAEGVVRTLGAAKVIDANWTTLAEKLSKDLRHHIQQEESEVFEAAQEVFSEAEAQQLGAAFERMKAAIEKDGDSVVASTVDLVANLLPSRLADSFRKGLKRPRPQEMHAPR